MENIKNELNLWELCIFADRDFLPFYQKSRSYIKQNCLKSAVAFNETENTFLFAVEQNFAEPTMSMLSNEICSYLLQKEKIKYLSSHLNNTSVLGELEPIFIKTLTIFDSEADRLEILKNLRLNQELHINEFYFFKCKRLQKKWQEICDMTNENDFFFSSNELTFQLIRFLLNNCKRKTEELLLIKEDNHICIYNNNNKVAIFNADEDKANSGNKIVVEILDNLPNRLVLKNKKSFDREFVGLLDLIFKNSLKNID